MGQLLYGNTQFAEAKGVTALLGRLGLYFMPDMQNFALFYHSILSKILLQYSLECDYKVHHNFLNMGTRNSRGG